GPEQPALVPLTVRRAAAVIGIAVEIKPSAFGASAPAPLPFQRRWHILRWGEVPAGARVRGKILRADALVALVKQRGALHAVAPELIGLRNSAGSEGH